MLLIETGTPPLPGIVAMLVVLPVVSVMKKPNTSLYADQPVETGDAGGLYHVGIDCAGRLLHILRIISCAALASSGVRGRLGAEPIGPTMTLFNN